MTSETAYRKRFGAAPYPLDFPSYDICRCRRCELEFATPAVAGDAPFYAWITATDRYYQAFRWEWDAVTQLMRHAALITRSSLPTTVLEIGTGTGNFLRHLSDALPVAIYGCDTHEPSVRTCQALGLNVELGEGHEVFPARRFDVICAFHCLEHVPDPLAFMTRAKERLNPRGTIYVSVPYSPTVYDVLDEDCLNRPPHHLTRWNKTSLEALAQRTNLDVELRTPPNHLGRFRSAVYALQEAHPELRGVPPLVLVWRVLGHTSARARVRRVAAHFLTRTRIGGNLAGDVVLAVFRTSD